VGQSVEPKHYIFKVNTKRELQQLSHADEQQNKSAIADHATRENHIIDWNAVKFVGHETDRRTRWIKETIAIRKHKGRAMNTDTGSYFLSSTYDKLLLCDSA